MDQAGGVCTSRDAQASGISRVELHRTRPFDIRQWTEVDPTGSGGGTIGRRRIVEPNAAVTRPPRRFVDWR